MESLRDPLPDGRGSSDCYPCARPDKTLTIQLNGHFTGREKPVTNHMVAALVHGEADAERGGYLRLTFLAGRESGTSRRAIRVDDELWRSGWQFDFGTAIPVAFALQGNRRAVGQGELGLTELPSGRNGKQDDDSVARLEAGGGRGWHVLAVMETQQSISGRSRAGGTASEITGGYGRGRGWGGGGFRYDLVHLRFVRDSIDLLFEGLNGIGAGQFLPGFGGHGGWGGR